MPTIHTILLVWDASYNKGLHLQKLLKWWKFDSSLRPFVGVLFLVASWRKNRSIHQWHANFSAHANAKLRESTCSERVEPRTKNNYSVARYPQHDAYLVISFFMAEEIRTISVILLLLLTILYLTAWFLRILHSERFAAKNLLRHSVEHTCLAQNWYYEIFYCLS